LFFDRTVRCDFFHDYYHIYGFPFWQEQFRTLAMQSTEFRKTAPSAFARLRRDVKEKLIPNPKARLREQVREVMRFHHYSNSTLATRVRLN
jgi:hypothetical protein